MKQLVVFGLALLINSIFTSPLKNGAFEKIMPDADKAHRWTLFPDSDGKMHLLDLNPYDIGIEPLFDPVTDTVFILLTRRNPTVGQIITWDLDVMRNSNFDASHPTRFTIHGWQSDSEARVNLYVAEEYFRQGEYNMITVDWSLGANSLNYITARNRVGPIGDVVANFIDFLHLNNFVRFEELHVIGTSLGGQIAGMTGKRVTRGRLQVIVACDPAGPLFSFDNPTERVANTDAVYVEVIHTNMGRLGFDQPIGDADFFPNYGVTMPGCEDDITGQCSHSRAHQFYAESISSPFTSRECSSFNDILNENCVPTGRTASMGGPNGNIGLTGIYYLTTNADSPFSMG